jgi:uncharacterized membrane protein YkoI
VIRHDRPMTCSVSTPRSRRRPLWLALILAAAVCVVVPAGPSRADDEDHIAAREALRRGEILPLNHILQIALRRVPGDVIEVELERDDEGWEYEVKVLTSTGRVREVTLNARNGAILKVEDD